MDNEVVKKSVNTKWFIVDPEDQHEMIEDLRREHNFEDEVIDGISGKGFSDRDYFG